MKIFGRIAYWLVALALVTAILISLDYTPGQAVLISLVFFPCAIALEFFLPKAETIRDKVFLSLAVLVSTTLLLLLVHRLLWSPFMKSRVWFILDVQPVLVNPVFLGLILTMLALGDYAWRKWLDRRLQAAPRQITFFSDRKTVTLPVAEIAYIESNDTEVRIFTLDGGQPRSHHLRRPGLAHCLRPDPPHLPEIPQHALAHSLRATQMVHLSRLRRRQKTAVQR